MRKLILLLFPIFVLTSCKTASEPETPKQTGPKVGSTFSYDYEVRGGENELIDEGSIVTTLVKAGSSYAGKNNVLVYVDNEGDTTHFAKESNGNISVFIDGDASSVMGFAQPFWINFPISGSGGEDRVLAQQQVDYHGVPATLRASLTSEFEANDAITIGQKQYAVKRAGTTIAIEVIIAGEVVDGYEVLNGTLWWMPELNAAYATQQTVELEDTRVFTQELTGVNLK